MVVCLSRMSWGGGVRLGQDCFVVVVGGAAWPGWAGGGDGSI